MLGHRKALHLDIDIEDTPPPPSFSVPSPTRLLPILCTHSPTKRTPKMQRFTRCPFCLDGFTLILHGTPALDFVHSLCINTYTQEKECISDC